MERTKQSTIDELGLAVLALSNIVPKGMVVFLPSYGYLDRVMLRWKNNGVLAKIQLKKPVFLSQNWRRMLTIPSHGTAYYRF